MAYSPERNSFLVPEEEQPRLEVPISGMVCECTWGNTSIYRIAVGDGQFNHIRHMYGPEQGIIVFMSEADPELVTALIDGRYPVHIMPQPDEVTLQVYADHLVENMEDSVPDFDS